MTIIKRLEDYTNSELLDLTNDEVEQLIDMECAHIGVRLLPDLPKKPEVFKAERDATIFSVGGIEFLDPGEAQEVADFINTKRRAKTGHVPGPGYEPMLKGQENTDMVSMFTKSVYSEAFYNTIASQKAQADAQMKDYTDAKKDYDEIMKERTSITEDVLDHIKIARLERQRLDMLCNEARRYMSLALADKEIAKRFMLDARKEHADLINAHFDEWVIENVRKVVSEAA